MFRSLIVIAICSMCFGQNLLQNPGFESWSGGLPDNWFNDDSIALFQEDVIVHGGNFSVRDSLFSQTQAEADLYQGNFPVQASTQYTYSVWIYENDPAGRVRQGIYWYPSGSSWSADYSADTTEWQFLSYTVTSPSDAESALVMIRAYDIAASWDGDAIFYIDDVTFEAPSTQPPVILRIWHTPVNPGAGNSVDVYANVTDDGTIQADTLYYGVNDLSSPIPLMHSSAANDTFLFTIPGQTTGDTILYYAVFVDDDGLGSVSDTHSLLIGEIGVYINEVLYDTPGGDQGCYIELYGSGGTNLNDFSIIGVNGYDGSEYVTIDLMGQSIPGDGFFVVAQDSTVPNYDMISTSADLQNGPDNVALAVNGITIDALGYGTLDGWYFTGEWTPAPDVDYDHALGRYPDGDDTDVNIVDFHDYTEHTPGDPNPSVSIAEHTSIEQPVRPVLPNPVSNGIRFATLLDADHYYPIMVYDVSGQLVQTIPHKNTHLNVPYGVYFLRMGTNTECACKIVVVK